MNKEQREEIPVLFSFSKNSLLGGQVPGEPPVRTVPVVVLGIARTPAIVVDVVEVHLVELSVVGLDVSVKVSVGSSGEMGRHPVGRAVALGLGAANQSKKIVLRGIFCPNGDAEGTVGGENLEAFGRAGASVKEHDGLIVLVVVGTAALVVVVAALVVVVGFLVVVSLVRFLFLRYHLLLLLLLYRF